MLFSEMVETCFSPSVAGITTIRIWLLKNFNLVYADFYIYMMHILYTSFLTLFCMVLNFFMSEIPYIILCIFSKTLVIQCYIVIYLLYIIHFNFVKYPIAWTYQNNIYPFSFLMDNKCLYFKAVTNSAAKIYLVDVEEASLAILNKIKHFTFTFLFCYPSFFFYL